MSLNQSFRKISMFDNNVAFLDLTIHIILILKHFTHFRKWGLALILLRIFIYRLRSEGRSCKSCTKYTDLFKRINIIVEVHLWDSQTQEGSIDFTGPFVVYRVQLGSLEESIGAEDAVSLSDIVPNASKCSVSYDFWKFHEFLFSPARLWLMLLHVCGLLTQCNAFGLQV